MEHPIVKHPVTRFLVGLIVFFVMWQLFACVYHDEKVLPKVTTVFGSLVDNSDVLKKHVLETGLEAVLAFVIAFVFAAATATIFEEFKTAEFFFSPLVTAFQVIPKVAIAPLLAIWLNSQLGPKIAMGALIAFYPIFEGFRDGLKADRTGLRQTLAVFAPNSWRIFWMIKLPEAVPQICGGARVGITFAMVGVIVGEMVRPSSGLGYIIEVAKMDDKVEFEYAAILLVSVVGAILYWLVQLLENSKWLHRFRFLPSYSAQNSKRPRPSETKPSIGDISAHGE